MPTYACVPAPDHFTGIANGLTFRTDRPESRSAALAIFENLNTLLFGSRGGVSISEAFRMTWEHGGRSGYVNFAQMVRGQSYVDALRSETDANALRDLTLSIIRDYVTTNIAPISFDESGQNEIDRNVCRFLRHLSCLRSWRQQYGESTLKLNQSVSVYLNTSAADARFVNHPDQDIPMAVRLTDNRYEQPIVFRVAMDQGHAIVRVNRHGFFQIDRGDAPIRHLRTVNVADDSIERRLLITLMQHPQAVTGRAIAAFCQVNNGRSWFGGVMTTPATRRAGMSVRVFRGLYRGLGDETLTSFARQFPRPARGWRESDRVAHGPAYPATARVIRRRARLWNWNAIPTDVAAIMSRDLELHLDDPTE